MKEGTSFILYMADPRNPKLAKITNYETYYALIKNEVKEVCPTCKNIFDKMFELRLHRLNELADELNRIYLLKTKSNLKERKNDKNKKNRK
jgi:hypothetical protein